MEKILIAIIIILALSLLMDIATKKKKQNKSNEELLDFPYKDKYILTKNEYDFYIQLKELAIDMKWTICPKVGLKDIFEVKSDKNYMGYFRKISQKHIDFLICDNDLKPLYAIELDDNSHNKKEAKESDEFKNKLFELSKIKLIRIKADKEYTKEYILRNVANATQC